jgi:hypothetical protein
MKNYKITPTKEQLRIIKAYWHKLLEIESEHYGRICELEAELSRETGIKELEFFKCDNEYVGIGNVERTMKLLHLR